MSSKFNIKPIPILRPAICKKPHGSCWPAWPPEQPLFVHAYLDLYDLDPADPIGASGYTQMPMVSPEPTYAGLSPPAPNRVGALIAPAAAPGYWNVEATLHPPAHASVSWFWFDVFIDPLRPFDTGLLHNVIIPGLDYQNVRIMQ